MLSVTTGAAGVIRVGWIPGELNRKTCLQIQQCLGIQGIIWLIQYSLTQHHRLVIFISLFLGRPLRPRSVLIFGWWGSNPRTAATRYLL